MAERRLSSRKLLLALAAISAYAALIAAIMLPEPRVAWNSGARERLGAALRAIERRITAGDANAFGKLDVRDFVARNDDVQAQLPGRAGDVLAERFGVKVKWRRGGVYRELLFYPIALGDEVRIEPTSPGPAIPQIVMVPLDDADKQTLPHLYGCRPAAGTGNAERRLRRIKTLFETHGINDVATLMSDGGVVYHRADDLLTNAAIVGGSLLWALLSDLADRLEQAGCTDADLIAHCRHPGEHWRRCWAVELILAKAHGGLKAD